MPITGMKITAMIQAIADDGLRLAETKIAAATAITMCPIRTSAATRSKSLILGTGRLRIRSWVPPSHACDRNPLDAKPPTLASVYSLSGDDGEGAGRCREIGGCTVAALVASRPHSAQCLVPLNQLPAVRVL